MNNTEPLGRFKEKLAASALRSEERTALWAMLATIAAEEPRERRLAVLRLGS